MNRIFAIVMILITININPLISLDYSFIEMEEYGFIRDIEFQNEEVYLLVTHSTGNYSILAFDTDNNKFETLFTFADFKKHGLTNIKDMVFFENDLYVINDNKLINLTDGYKEYSFVDEYDFKPKSDKYRKLHNVTIRDNSLIIGSTSTHIIDRNENTGVDYAESFNELFRFKSDQMERILDERETNIRFDFYLSPVLDKQNNFWFIERQNAPLKGGLIKISENYKVEVFDLKSYSNVNYHLQPTSIDLVDNFLYIGLSSRKESNYLEGLSIFDFEKQEWDYTIDYLTNNDIYEGYSWETPQKIKKLDNGNLVILGNQFTVQIDDNYLYYDIKKLQEEKGFIQDYNKNLDIFENDDNYFIIRQNGILVFEKSSITSVTDEIKEKYDYRISNNLIEFKNNEVGNYTVYDVVGKVIIDDAYESTINLSNLPIGPYFIELNNEYIIKFIKE